MIRVAFDIGGTFTDFVLHDDGRTGEKGIATYFLKVPSTPKDPGAAVMAGLENLCSLAGIKANLIETVLHATTVATNAVLERKGSPTGLITTEGFRDVLIIGRQKRYETYDLYIDKPEPLVPRRHIIEVEERVSFDGAIVTKLNEESIDRAIDALLAAGLKTVAVSLLHAYANSSHEETIRKRILARAPELLISLSSEVAPKFREYERTNTTVANAYIRPIVAQYISRLQDALHQWGYTRELFIMQSSGGLVSTSIATVYPIRIIESGPAAGVLMGSIVGKSEDHKHVITFDMGGTTAKLGAVDDGTPAIMPTFEIDHVRYKKGSGLPINAPSVELLEIGAGGGSIARIEMGMIAVGPDSAGADPGPICYGRGGTMPTITDANLVLGYISPNWFNAGTMALDYEGAAHGIMEKIGGPLGLELGAAAWGVHLVATMNMENALRIVSVEQGRDPRHYAMIAFGGAGPLHATRLARAVGIPKVIVPYGAGVGSAIGLLQAAPRIDVSTTKVMTLDEHAGPAIANVYAELKIRAEKDLKEFGISYAPEWSRYGYMRYSGQGFEVQVNLPNGIIDEDFGAQAVAAFNKSYFQKHKFLDPDARIEAVDWTLVATLTDGMKGASVSQFTVSNEKADSTNRDSRRLAWFPETGGFTNTPVLDRTALKVNSAVSGPAIIEDPDSTTVLLPGDMACVTSAGHLNIEVGKEAV